MWLFAWGVDGSLLETIFDFSQFPVLIRINILHLGSHNFDGERVCSDEPFWLVLAEVRDTHEVELSAVMVPRFSPEILPLYTRDTPFGDNHGHLHQSAAVSMTVQ